MSGRPGNPQINNEKICNSNNQRNIFDLYRIKHTTFSYAFNGISYYFPLSVQNVKCLYFWEVYSQN